MAQVHLKLSDSDIAIGELFLATTHLPTTSLSRPVPTTLERIERLERDSLWQRNRIRQLESDVYRLERRTWWGELKRSLRALRDWAQEKIYGTDRR